MNALEYIKLARAETYTGAGEDRAFTFAHRRFQEYFATSVVLRDVSRVEPKKLLTDGQWRETAVTILQIQAPEDRRILLEEAGRLLKEAAARFDPVDLQGHEAGNGALRGTPFRWPPNALHLLNILDNGFMGRDEDLPRELQQDAANILTAATRYGQIFDRKWALEAAGTVPLPILGAMIGDAFGSQSRWLKEVAYRQVARLQVLPARIANEMRRALVSLSAGGRLRREVRTVRAQIALLDQANDFIGVVRLLLFAPFVDLAAHIGLGVIIRLGTRSRSGPMTDVNWRVLALLIASHMAFYVVRIARPFSWHRPPNRWAPVFRLMEILTPRSGETHTEGLSGGAAVYAFALVRFGLLLSAVLRAMELGGWVKIAFVGAFVYSMTWSLAALVSAQRGRFTRLWYWPFVQISLAEVTYELARKWIAMSDLRRLVRTAGAGALGLAVVVGLVYFLSRIQWITLPLTFIPPAFIAWVGGSSFLATHLHDWRQVRSWRQSRSDAIDGSEFVMRLAQLRTAGGAVGFVRYVTREGLLPYSAENRDLLVDLVEAAERAPRKAGRGFPRVERSVYERWRAAKPHEGANVLGELQLGRFGDELVDELGRMVEHAEAMRAM